MLFKLQYFFSFDFSCIFFELLVKVQSIQSNHEDFRSNPNFSSFLVLGIIKVSTKTGINSVVELGVSLVLSHSRKFYKHVFFHRDFLMFFFTRDYSEHFRYYWLILLIKFSFKMCKFLNLIAIFFRFLNFLAKHLGFIHIIIQIVE